MSPPVREDFAHGHLFCFVLDTDKEAEFSDDMGASDSTADTERSMRDDNEDECVSRSQLSRLINVEDVNMGVFGTVPDEDGAGDGSAHGMRQNEELQVEEYNAFMRLQLVRQKAVSLNNAMIAMRDSKGELSAAFEWLDICTDTLNSAKLDRKKVKDLQGSMYTPASQIGRQAVPSIHHVQLHSGQHRVDKESNVIPDTLENLLDTSVLESDVVSRDANNGNVDTVKYHAVHSCGFVWNTNTLGFVSDAWADRCIIMESEFPTHLTRTRSSNQLQDTVERLKIDRVAAVCLYRQNLIQSATMIAKSEIMQFSLRFDAARDTYVTALYSSHIVCTGAASRRVSFCINQLVFAEAMKLACHFVFDMWVPPWTEVPDDKAFPDLRSFMAQLKSNRLEVLDKLSFGQICLETNALYKLCAAACLPDICP
ncbi:hypothetical protein Q5P01_010554 [Channa striata]|uniref:Uncharacterized protein n=1 Tax=Channa striata TaxID=64152 RepID=A0AA88ST90_CHASR|nr:hypothetical protein Q5P01_010554 [Channa striata]